MADTAIEWTDKTWNPTTGCDKVSPGCDNCYAMTMAKRLKGMGSAKYQKDGDPRTSGPGFLAVEHDDELLTPLSWRKPARVFVNSMSDLFHGNITSDFIVRVLAVMAMTPRHTYQILTKRPARMRNFMSQPSTAQLVRAFLVANAYDAPEECTWPLPNVWLGVSVEDQGRADLRIPALLGTPAAVRFLSCEPLLGHVDLKDHLFPTPCEQGCGCRLPSDPDSRDCGCDGNCCMHPDWPFDSGIHWVIAGGESGPGARPMHPWWVDDLKHQCASWGVPFLFKQWGEWRPAQPGEEFNTMRGRASRPPAFLVSHDDGTVHCSIEAADRFAKPMLRVGKKAAGRVLDGRTWDEFPEVSR